MSGSDFDRSSFAIGALAGVSSSSASTCFLHTAADYHGGARNRFLRNCLGGDRRLVGTLTPLRRADRGFLPTWSVAGLSSAAPSLR